MNIHSIENHSEMVGAFARKNHADVHFRVWAPLADSVDVVLYDDPENSKSINMNKAAHGYFEVTTREARVGSKYKFRLNGRNDLPDPASRFQPDGVHGPSEVVAQEFNWSDGDWRGLDIRELVISEIHVGTFTQAGTFAGVIEKLVHFKNLGINAIEIMPVAQFPGVRNWGYDGVGLFAAQNSYGGPLELKRLVNECHRNGIAVILDVVYNHLGPEGNYLSQFGRYFQTKYKTPWGAALNFDDVCSDEVRKYFLQNASQWLEEFHFDGLRLDAVHAIFDASAQPFLEDLGRMKRALEKRVKRSLHLIAESDTNDARILKLPEDGGTGLDAHWADDLHHALHARLTGERQGYYADYGALEHVARIFEKGVAYNGGYSEFRQRSHGRAYDRTDRFRLVVCSQNHDQIGNRMLGDRLLTQVGPEKQKLAAACVLLSPFLPLVFMGEEFAETAPFAYFVDHGDPDLLEAVRRGRKEEFSGFEWQGEPPDPASSETYAHCRLHWEKTATDRLAQSFLNYYRRLIGLSKQIRMQGALEAGRVEARVNGELLEIYGRHPETPLQLIFNFGPMKAEVQIDSRQSSALEIIFESWDDIALASAHKTKPLLKPMLELPPYGAVMLQGK